MSDENSLVELLCGNDLKETQYLAGQLAGQERYIIKDIYWDAGSLDNPLNIGLNDVVEAHPNEDGDLWVTDVITKSGYTTLRLFASARSMSVEAVKSRQEDVVKFSDFLKEAGCP